MSDYLLKVKIQNNKIVSLMRQQGIESVSELHRRTKISVQILHGFINMTESPLMQHNLFGKKANGIQGDGLWRKAVLVLADFFGVLPEEMFNEQQLTSPLKNNKAERSIELDQVLMLMGAKTELALEDSRFEDERKKIIDETLQCLNPREKLIIEQRYGLKDQPLTYDQIGEVNNVTGVRIRQMEHRALGKLRSPTIGTKKEELQSLRIEENSYDPDSFEYKNKVTFILKEEQKKLLLQAGNKWRAIACEYRMHKPSVGKFIDQYYAAQSAVRGTNV